jgi:hypothetical protein
MIISIVYQQYGGDYSCKATQNSRALVQKFTWKNPRGKFLLHFLELDTTSSN